MRMPGVVISTLCLAVAAATLVPAPAAAAVDPACREAPSPTPVIREVPWAQDMYDAREKIWPFSTGAGVTVAVIDSGVDARHPQLRGRVLPGYDFVRDTPEGDVDCLPHGTAVASIIAGKRIRGIGFFGLAPRAKILPVRITEKVQLSPQSDPMDPSALADGIDYAVDQGAQVLNVSAVVYRDDPRLAAAVSRALARGAVIVAAVGNGHVAQQGGIAATDPSLTPYPAAYDGVIGVGAVEASGQRLTSSQIGPYVDIVAPGGKVTAAGVIGQNIYDGTSFASAFVSAVGALLLAQRPSLLRGATGKDRAAAVRKRLLATASPTAAGPNSAAYGHGVVDPYRALTEVISDVRPAELSGGSTPPRDPAAEQFAAERRSANGSSMFLGAAAIALVLLVVAGVVLLPRGVRRRWRPGRAVENTPAENDDGPEFLPGSALFEQTPDSHRVASGARSP